MGERSFDLVQNVGDQGNQQDDGRGRKNPFGGLIDNAKGLFGKAKEEVQKIDKDDIGDAIGKAGRAVGQGADKIGMGGVGRSAEELAGSGERMVRGQGTAQDRERLIGAGIEAGKLAVGGGTFQIAEQLARRSGVNIPGIGGLGGIFDKGAREITRLDTLGFVKAVRDNWDTLDADKNGFISKEEIAKASEDSLFRYKNAHMLSILDTMHTELSNCQNDEIGSEKKGVSRGDIYALEKGKLEGTGFGGVGATFDGAWEAKYPALLAGGGTAWLNHGKVPTSKMLTRSGLVTLGVGAIGGAYGAIDYYGSRKENIEKVISELK